jgi:hypothetical protein
MITRLRIALGFIREGDPRAWRCDLCHALTNRDECYNHRVRVMRAPDGPPPPPPPMPRRYVYEFPNGGIILQPGESVTLVLDEIGLHPR